VSVEDDKPSRQPSTSKTTENVEKIWYSLWICSSWHVGQPWLLLWHFEML
jgi:hypothetical protein